MWTPHLYLVNEHESHVMGSSRPDVLVSIQPDGTVLYSSRYVTLILMITYKHLVHYFYKFGDSTHISKYVKLKM